MSTTFIQQDLENAENVALVHSAKQGDMGAFETLVERNTALIFRVVMHILGSREDAEDAVQDAFLKAFLHLQDFQERSRFSTWLTRIAVNEALSRLRSSRRSISISIDEDTDESSAVKDRIADWKPDPEQLYSSAELRHILNQALASLPHLSRVIFLLRDVEGLSIADTAEMLHLRIPTVKARLFRARLKLRERLSQHFEPGRSVPSSALLERGIGAFMALR